MVGRMPLMTPLWSDCEIKILIQGDEMSTRTVNKHIFDLLIQLGYAKATCKEMAILNGQIIKRRRHV
jgi:hypothetical protein